MTQIKAGDRVEYHRLPEWEGSPAAHGTVTGIAWAADPEQVIVELEDGCWCYAHQLVPPAVEGNVNREEVRP